MTQATRIETADIHQAGTPLDVLGIGFGPANLALALCLEELPEPVGGRNGQPGRPPRSLFLERKPTYDWHPDMLLEGAEIQVPFLKDLVTMRNPQSRFTFLNYLHLHGRLLDFVNLRSWFPTRLEFNHYYRWVASQLAHRVRYHREVLAVAPAAGERGRVELLRVTARHADSGKHEEYLTRRLVVATGGLPYIPPGIDPRVSDRVFHSCNFLQGIRRHFPDPDAPYRFIVVGSGQSAAEIFQYLFSHYPNAEVTATLRRFAYKPADESEFVNEIYSPLMIDVIYGLPADERRSLQAAHADTNYSAVDLELIRAIFRALYQKKVMGDNRVRVRSLVELRGLAPHGTALVARLWNKVAARMESLEADGVVLATGFERPRRHPLLAELDPYLVSTPAGDYEVGRDYRVHTVPAFTPRIYLQGFCESTHGISDTVLSVLPVRSREITDSILADLAGPALHGEELADIAEATPQVAAGAAGGWFPAEGDRR
jgi:L-ornithine N5-oxygenase